MGTNLSYREVRCAEQLHVNGRCISNPQREMWWTRPCLQVNAFKWSDLIQSGTQNGSASPHLVIPSRYHLLQAPSWNLAGSYFEASRSPISNSFSTIESFSSIHWGRSYSLVSAEGDCEKHKQVARLGAGICTLNSTRINYAACHTCRKARKARGLAPDQCKWGLRDSERIGRRTNFAALLTAQPPRCRLRLHLRCSGVQRKELVALQRFGWCDLWWDRELHTRRVWKVFRRMKAGD